MAGIRRWAGFPQFWNHRHKETIMLDARPRETKRPGAAGSVVEQPGPNTTDWRASLPGDWTAPGRDASGAEVQLPLRQHPALAKYVSKDEAIKALVHAQRLLGKKGEAACGADGSLLSQGFCPEGSACPASPAEYRLPELDMPEDFSVDEALRAAFLEKAHELSLSDAQVAGLYAWFMPLNVQALRDRHEEAKAERVRIRERELGALRKVHGGAAQGILEAARKAVLALGGKELMERLEASGAADDARVIQVFARVAPLVSETALRARDAAPAQSLTPQRLREMMRDPRYFDSSRRDPDYVQQVREGFESLYPGEKPQGLRA
jgi:hypothetical protein